MQEKMKRILLIDDDPATLDVIKILFEMEGFEVLGLADTAELYPSILSFKPSVILMDVLIGAIDGRDICAELKASTYKHIPLMLMSVVSKFTEDPSHPMFCDDYIHKPFELDVMLSKVRKLILDHSVT